MNNWIEHDGTCCPVPVGTWVEVMNPKGKILSVVVTADHHVPWVSGRTFNNWFWQDQAWALMKPNQRIIAYRLPSSRAAEDLIERIRNLEPEKEPA